MSKPEAGLDPDDLLAVAIETYRRDVLPAVAPDRRYEALMVGNALQITLRRLRDQTPDENAATLLAALLAAIHAAPADLEDPDAPQRALVASIRSGRLDDPRAVHAELRAFLRADVLARLAISNPKADPPLPDVH